MSISGQTLETATSWTPVLGTTRTLARIADVPQGGLFVFGEETNPLTRHEMAIMGKQPKVLASAPAGYSQGRSTVSIKLPLTLANGLTTHNTIRCELSYDRETSISDIDLLVNAMTAFLQTAGVNAIWRLHAVE